MKIDQRLVRVRQNVEAPEVTDLRQGVIESLREIDFQGMDFTGQTIGLTAGSRGIESIPQILAILAEQIRGRGGKPVIIPAMGTHGGSTAERQLSLLESLGITEKAVNCPLLNSIETIPLGLTPEGIPVFCNEQVTKVDKIIPVNRIKAHTDFSGSIESGLCKIMVIGLGAHRGAETTHSYARLLGHEKTITSVARFMLEKLPVVFGFGIVENYKGKTAALKAMLADEILEKEKEALDLAKKLQIKLPFDALDLLIVGEMGKNISGTGMDTKVVGRIMVKGQKEPEKPRIECIAVLDLTQESHGNACGIGLAEITTKRAFDKIDLLTTGDNAISSMSPEQGRMPCVVLNDFAAIKSGIFTLGPVPPEKVRLVYIRNTLRIEKLAVSEALLDEVKSKKYLEILGEPEELKFDPEGNLLSFRDDF